MKSTLKYSVLRYVPHIDSGESINIGILISDIDCKYKEFYYTSNLNRIKSFDDEVNIRRLKSYLNSMTKDVEMLDFNSFNIDNYVRFYINSINFADVTLLKYDDIKDAILSLKKLYLRYDFDKKNRSTRSEDKKLLLNIVKSNYKKELLDNKVTGKYSEDITYDIVTKDFCVKFFDIKSRNISSFINQAKVWIVNGKNEKRKSYVVYRYEEMNNDSRFNIISNIFKDSKTKFIEMSDFDKILKKA